MNLNFENIKKVRIDKDLQLDCGTVLKGFDLAYETYGKLNETKTNAILVFHALSGDQFVCETNTVTSKEGWWTFTVGKNKAIDTNKYFVICANVLGGCMGTTGPKEIDPSTNKPYGLNFPVVTIKDMVTAQVHLLDLLGIKKTLAVLGGSMGGMQALQFCTLFPERTYSAIPIACAASHSAQNIAFNELARQAIMADPEWDSGNYISSGKVPRKGLAIARNIQISEFAKISLVIFMAKYFHKLNAQKTIGIISAIIPLFVSLVLFLLVAVQPDLGTALIILILGLVAIFYAGIKLIYPFLSFIAIVSVSPFLWTLLKPYQQDRIMIFLNPDLDPLGQGYHIIQSKIAIGSGGLNGNGFLEGSQSSLDFLPEKETDFVFAIFSEQFGFSGSLLLILIFLFFF